MNTRSISPRLLLLFCLPLAPTGAILAADSLPTSALNEPDYGAQLTQDQLDELLGPIALYPDALIALILPASTSPAEIVLAARFINAKGDPSQIDNQPWSDSVKALARYPEVITWMDTNLQWTKELGDAFAAQPTDLMNSVQRLRSIAKSNGALVSTPQQKVIVEDEAIEIIPAEPDVIYIPRYDPEVVYIERSPTYYYPGPFITFGAAFAAGVWLHYDFDWRAHTIWVGDRRHDWREHRDWRLRQAPGPSYPSNSHWQAWRPPAHRPPTPGRSWNQPAQVYRPQPFPGTPNFPRPPRPSHPGDSNQPAHQQGNGNSRPTRPENSDRHQTPPSAATYNRATPLAPARATPVEPARATPAPVDRPQPDQWQHRPPSDRPSNPPSSDRRSPTPRTEPPSAPRTEPRSTPPPTDRRSMPPRSEPQSTPPQVDRRATPPPAERRSPPSERSAYPMPSDRMPNASVDRRATPPNANVQPRVAPPPAPPPPPKAPLEKTRDRDPRDREN